MSSRMNSFLSQLWNKFKNKEYRHAFAAARLATNIPAQIYSMREARGWTQKQLAEAAGMAQSRISLLEDSLYDKYSLSTLKRLAETFDVAVVVEFISFSDLAKRSCDPAPEKLAVPDFEHDYLDNRLGVGFGDVSLTATPNVYVLPVAKAARAEVGQTMITDPGSAVGQPVKVKVSPSIPITPYGRAAA